MSNDVVHQSVFEWSAPLSSDLRRKELVTRLSSFGVGLGLVLWGIASIAGFAGDVRYLLVVGAMVIGLGILGLMESRRLRSTRIRVDRMGTLTVVDHRGSSSVDLRTVSALSVRRRNVRPQWKWSIEAVHPGGGWHTELGSLATYWNLEDEVIAALEADLRRWWSWATGGVVPVANGVSDPGVVPPDGASRFAGSVAGTAGRFEWQPPEHPNKRRNRRRVRIGFLAFGALIAVIAAISEAENGLTAVLFSMFVPVLILLIGFGVDRAYDIGRRFRLVVDRAGLTVTRGSKPPLVIPAADVTGLTVGLVSLPTHDTSVQSNAWFLTVTRVSEEDTRVPLPLALGSSFDRSDAIALEAALRHRLGLAS